jgi:hypothetical protein
VADPSLPGFDEKQLLEITRDGTAKLTQKVPEGTEKAKTRISQTDADYIFAAFSETFANYRRERIPSVSGHWRVRLLTDDNEVYFYHGANGQDYRYHDESLTDILRQRTGMPELFGLCVRAETKNKVKSIEISLEQTAADEVKDQYANEYGICIHDTNEWLLVSSEVLWYRWRGENTLLPLWGRNLRGRYGRGPDTDEAHIGYKFGIVPKTRFRKRWRRHKRFWALPKKQNREKKKEGLRTAPLFLIALFFQNLSERKDRIADTFRAGTQNFAGSNAFHVLADGSTAFTLEILYKLFRNTGRAFAICENACHHDSANQGPASAFHTPHPGSVSRRQLHQRFIIDR